jgi:hypothetical protein
MTRTRALLVALLVGTLPTVGVALAGVESEGSSNIPPDMSQGAGGTQNEYSIPPVNPKSLKNADNHPWNKQTVKNPQGQILGTIDHVMVDTQSGKDMYAMLKLSDDMQPMPVPFNYIKEGQSGLIMNATKQQLQKSGPNLGGKGKSQDFEHFGGEPLNPSTRQGGS